MSCLHSSQKAHVLIAHRSEFRKTSKKESLSFGGASFKLLNSFKLAIKAPAMMKTMTKGDAAATIVLTSGASDRVNALLSMRVLRNLMVLINAVVLFLLFPFRGRPVLSSSGSVVVPSSSCSEKGKSNKDHNERQESVHRKAWKGIKGGPVMRVPTIIFPWKTGASAVDQEVASRRALAIRRVMQDDDRDAGDESVRNFSLFLTSRGATVFTRSWSPVSTKVRGLVVVLHGLNEHSGRYDDFAKQLNANGYKVHGMDWIGHGGSDGLHAYVHSLDDAVADLKSFLGKILEENSGLTCFCFGHSTGAAIILKAMLDPKVESRIAGVVLTSPAVGVQPSHPIFTVLAPVFSFLLPKYQFSAANKKGLPVSRDPEALVAKYSDPLVYTGSIRVRTGYEILRITSYLKQNLSKLKVPFLVLHGTADTVTDPRASQQLYEEATSTDKTLKLLDGFLHDLLFEPEREEIVKDIIHWLKNRI